MVAGENPWSPPLNDRPGLVYTRGGSRLGNPMCNCCLYGLWIMFVELFLRT